MIDDNVLENRLNKYRNSDKSEISNNIHKSTQETLTISIISLCVWLIKSIIYGYSIHTIFQTNWDFLGIFCVGCSITILLNYIYDLIY